MSVDFIKARQFVYAKGTLAERALFAYLFEDGSLDRLHQCWLCYKNDDNGFGHALEHDIRYPGSHPLALEFLLSMLKYTQVPIGNLLAGSAQWVANHQGEDGGLLNPEELTAYPYAPWWDDGGQKQSTSIVGNLTTLGADIPDIHPLTVIWAENNWNLNAINREEWLFMMYHAFDYYFAVEDVPEVGALRAATVDRIITLAENMPENQYYSLLPFVATKDSPVYQQAPDLVNRVLDRLCDLQQDDGSWHDQHGIEHWYPWVTISVLLALVRYRRVVLP